MAWHPRLLRPFTLGSTPSRFRAVGAFYDDFRQVSVDEVRLLLAEAATQGRALPPQSTVRAHGDADVPQAH
ncbi:MAG: hypothetical protein ACRDQZ_01410 [Mycobacteriales bacterium]